METNTPKRGRGRPKKLHSLTEMSMNERLTHFLPYLTDIQHKLLNLIIVFCGATLIGFFKYDKLLALIMRLFDLRGVNMVLTSPYQFFSLAINTGLVVGILVTFPLLLYYLLTFLRPALKPAEYKLITHLLPAAAILFIMGFIAGSWILQFVIGFYNQTTLQFSVGNIWDIGHFFSQIIVSGLCLGLMFQMPIIMTVLIRLHLLPYHFFTRYRRYFYAAILILAAVLPPNDPFSLALLTFPPLILFEFALLYNRGVPDITNISKT